MRVPGASFEPFWFEAVQLMIWTPVSGGPILQFELAQRGGYNWAVPLVARVAAQLANELLAIRERGMPGVWKIGGWPRQLRFTFRGYTSDSPALVRGIAVHISVFPVSS